MAFHVLLVGIDDYAMQPLRGCVNDIDAMQRLLLDRAMVPEEQILRLASPRTGTECSTQIPSQPATLANLQTALALIVERAKELDRILLYYSGHGARVEVAGPGQRTFHREALVPVDVDRGSAETLLYDHEINQLLGDLAARSCSVTVVLDCCHAAGATRDVGPTLTPRILDASSDLGLSSPIQLSAAGALPGGRGMARSVDACQVIAACLGYEQAQEGRADNGLVHGLLTRALVRALEKISDHELRWVPWSRIWQAVRAEVEERNPRQHPWMSGHAGRAVLAGPPVDGDPGFGVRLEGDHYEIEAGTLANVTESAVIAIYDERPLRFPPLASEADREARLGVVHVTEARLSTATARAEGHPFGIPSGARARLVQPGALARLRCAIVPANKAVTAAIAASPLLEVVDPDRARVRLEEVGDRWILTDDLHGIEPGTELCVLAASQLGRARDVLEHYFSYALPMRLAEATSDLPGALELSILVCPHELPPATADTTDLAEAPIAIGSPMYDVIESTRLCFRVRNRSRLRLRVSLVNAAGSGHVQMLGDPSIDAGRTHTFWAGSTTGVPFEMILATDQRQSIDRLIAIGSTTDRDVRYLGLDRGFADILAAQDGDRDVIPDPPVEDWTATQVLLRIRSPLGGRYPGVNANATR